MQINHNEEGMHFVRKKQLFRTKASKRFQACAPGPVRFALINARTSEQGLQLAIIPKKENVYIWKGMERFGGDSCVLPR